MADLLYLMGFFEGIPPVGPVQYDPNNLHITLIPTHAVPDNKLDKYVHLLTKTRGWLPELVFTTDSEIHYFGDDKSIPVVTLMNPEPFRVAHNTLLGALDAANGKIMANDRDRIGDKYTPHISYGTADMTGNITTLSLIHHAGGFGVNVQNLVNIPLI